MYKILLCWRYLRTRWIALASIVSVTLGVATMIVVNSVMNGFTEQMHNRIHGILSDIVAESHSSTGISDPGFYESKIRDILGDRLEGLTTVVTLPAMLTFEFNGASHTQQISLIGIDSNTYATVSDFSQFLLHPANRERIQFELREDGYGPDRPELKESGWDYRRKLARIRKEMDRLREDNERYSREQRALHHTSGRAEHEVVEQLQLGSETLNKSAAESQGFSPNEGPSLATVGSELNMSKELDPEFQTRPGVVIGIGIGSMPYRDPTGGKVKSFFFLKPGDDVNIAMFGAGTPLTAISEPFTVVDLYESKMSEYDSTFVFVPLEKLQQMRNMTDPSTGIKAVTSIQMKLKPGTDLKVARDELRAAFPPERHLIHVNTWRDSQGPLLSAVQLETTILNILLFMIIAVAGFGILATFFMIVVEKTRDIGVMKSLGAPGSGIASIFLSYGLLLGAVGSGVGALLGLLFVWRINNIAALVEWITGREVFDPTVYYFDTIPTVIHPMMVVWVVFGAMLIAILASVLPSIRAARMHPVEALRYE